ncbi:hypothetical protein BC832DRAFT_170471 [Gaertneriomyces semiglobifer]|nr:hypothetical protein BC832DRAFT_170471 [Gaertneriomyces semiglobifer]
MLTGAREAITLGVASVFQKMSSVSREGLKALSEEDPFREACLHIADSGYTQQPKVMKTPEAPMSEPIRSSMSKSSSHGSLRKMGTLSRNNSTRSVSGLFRKKKTTKEAFVATHPMLGPIFVLLRKEDEVDLIKATIVSQYAYAIQHIPTSDLRTVFVDNVLKEYFLSEKVLKTLQKEMLLPASGDALTEEINRLTGEVASKMKEGNHNDWEERLAPLEGLLTRLPNHILVDTLVLREKEPDIERSGIPYFIPSILGEVATHFVAPRSFSEVCHFFGISVVTPPKYEPLTWETRAKTGKNEEIAGHLAEILKTESAFLDRLEVLQQFNEHLVKNAAQSGLQSDRYAQCCCPHVGNLIREVKKLLEEAQSDSTSIAHVCEVYSRMLAPGSPLRTALSNYISDFHAAELRLPVDDTRAVQLKDSLERFRKEVLKRGDLQWKNLRSEPIQRLTRYPSLFKTLFEHTPKHHKDSAMMHRAYTTAHNMANEAQSLDQDYKESEFLSTLDSKLKFQGQLMSAGLKLICEVAADVKTSGSPAYGITIMLFNRCVVLLHRSEQKNKYLNKDKITLKELHPMASEGCLSDKGAKPHQTLLCNARNINDKRHFLRAFRHFRLLEEYSPSLRMRGLPSCHSLERLYATHYNGVDIYFRLVDLPKFGEDAKSAVGLVVFSRNQDLTEVIDKAKDSYRKCAPKKTLTYTVLSHF